MQLLLPQHIAFKCIIADAATEMLLSAKQPPLLFKLHL